MFSNTQHEKRRSINSTALPSSGSIIPQNPAINKLNYWKNKLNNLTPLALRTDLPLQTDGSFQGQRAYLEVDKIFIQKLTEVANQQHASLHHLFLAALYVVLYRYTGQPDLCIGTTPGNQHIVSPMATSYLPGVIPVRVNLDSQLSFKNLLQQVTTTIAEGIENHSPFDLIANELGLNLNQPTYFKFQLDKQADENYLGFIEFNTNAFKEKTITRLVEHLKNILGSLAKNPNEKISNIFFLTAEEGALLTKEHRTAKEPVFDDFVPQIFSRIARSIPDKTAVVFHKSATEMESITYRELDKKSDILASLLRNFRIGSAKPVGIAVSRSINLPIAMWSALKAGGPPIPLETHASELLNYKLMSIDLDLVIVDNTTEHIFTAYKKRVFAINIDKWALIESQARKLGLKCHLTLPSPHNAAYITYTSGTSGKPKGIITSHVSLTNLAHSLEDRGLMKGSKVLCTAPPTFDCFYLEMLEALVTQGEMHLIFEEGRLSAQVLQEIISRHNINVVVLLPHISNNLNFKKLPSLNDITVMGAASNEKTFQSIADIARERRNKGEPDLILRNEYGVSEAGVNSTINSHVNDEQHTSIGKPIRNTRLFILDPDGINECPIGVAGELYIEGPSLASGYLDKQLTKEKFVYKIYHSDKHSFEPVPDESMRDDDSLITESRKRKKSPCLLEEKTASSHKKPKIAEQANHSRSPCCELMRLYRTGDLVRRLESGSLEFIGRIAGNKQIKIHGVRLEIDAIEAALQNHPAIKEAVVTFDSSSETLTGHIILKNPDHALKRQDINTFIRRSHLHQVVQLNHMNICDRFPMNANGKIDTKALAQLEHKQDRDDTGSNEMLTPLQKRLKAIWQEVLNIPINSITTSLEELGCDSVFRVNLEARINQELEPKPPITVVHDIKLDMTIENLAHTLQGRCTSLTGNPASLFHFYPPLNITTANQPNFLPNPLI